jgi:nocardicin N-oxygenase
MSICVLVSQSFWLTIEGVSTPLPVYPAPKDDPALPTGMVYTEQRSKEPVSRVALPSGHQAWLVSRYEDVRMVLADQRFSRYLLYPARRT